MGSNEAATCANAAHFYMITAFLFWNTRLGRSSTSSPVARLVRTWKRFLSSVLLLVTVITGTIKKSQLVSPSFLGSPSRRPEEQEVVIWALASLQLEIGVGVSSIPLTVVATPFSAIAKIYKYLCLVTGPVQHELARTRGVRMKGRKHCFKFLPAFLQIKYFYFANFVLTGLIFCFDRIEYGITCSVLL